MNGTSNPPLPSVCDVLWIAAYVPMTAALLIRIRATRGTRAVVMLDVLIGLGAVGSVSAMFVLAGSPSLVTSLAYPVCDLVLSALVLYLAAERGWRLGPVAALVSGCLLYWALSYTVYTFQVVHGTFRGGGLPW
jgi:hypothetical protein